MISEAIISALGGGLLRLVPEVMNLFDKKNERKHELAMLEKQTEYARAEAASRLEAAKEEHAAQVDVGMVEALVKATEAQGRKTGFKIVDGMSASVRPVITLSFFALYAGIKIKWAIYGGGEIWTNDDWNLMSAIFMFWFCGRPWERFSAKR